MPASSRFKDHFSDQSANYARHRPHYPAALIRFLAGLTDNRRLAWDCATGSGQAAVVLADYFERVIATDASDAQIARAIGRPGVDYHIALAEDSGLDDGSVDLVTVGQALHWFDIEHFFGEATRVLVRGGVLAVWCYGLCEVSAACDAIVDRLYTDIVGEFWPPERRMIEERYAGIVLPGSILDAPDFDMRVSWSAADMLGYLRSWSACNRYEQARGRDPVTLIEEPLRSAWGGAQRTVTWPLALHAARL